MSAAAYEPIDFGQEWCPDCHRRVTITDQFTHATYTRDGETEKLVQLLACGHSWQGPETITGPAPGSAAWGALR